MRNLIPHFKSMVQISESELEYLEKKLSDLSGDLGIANSNLNNIDIDPKIKIQELYTLIKEEEKNEVTQNVSTIISNYTENKTNASQFINELQLHLDELNYLDINYLDKEKEIVKLNQLKQNINEFKEYIIVNEKISFFKYFDLNSINYFGYIENREKYNTVLGDYENLIKRLAHPLFAINDFNQQVGYLVTYDSNYSRIVEQYNNLTKAKKDIEVEITNLEKDILEKFGLEKRLLGVAQEFLKKNINLTSCPVCMNKFDIKGTLKDLENRLSSELSPLYSEINKSLDTNKIKLEDYNTYIKN